MSRSISDSLDSTGTDLRARLADAEALLERVRQVIFRKEGRAIGLEDWLERNEVIVGIEVSAGMEVTDQHSIDTSASEAVQDTTDVTVEEEDKTVDISALTLSALLIRKRLISGQIGEVEGEQEILSLLSSAPGITREQEESVRKWAGIETEGRGSYRAVSSPLFLAFLLSSQHLPPSSPFFISSYKSNLKMANNNETLSNKVGNATNGTIGDQAIVNQAVHLVRSTVDYAKGVAGIGHAKAATSVQDATHNPQGQQTAQTLGGLVNESRDLAANVLGAVKDVVAATSDKAKDATSDAKDTVEKGKPVGYVGKVRDLAAAVIGTAQGIIATGAAKVDETTGSTNLSGSVPSATSAQSGAQNLVNDATRKATDGAKNVDAKASNLQQSALDATATAAAYGKAAADKASQVAGNVSAGAHQRAHQ